MISLVRRFSFVALITVVSLFAIFSLASALAQSAPSLTPIVFYIAKGPPDSCGLGCDTWIAAHGDFDLSSDKRFEDFLKKTGKQNLPVFFQSAGGILSQAMSVGRSLRVRKMSAGVGFTIPLDCGGRVDSERCKAAVKSGRVLDSALIKAGRCSSACILALMGASRREIFDGVFLHIHSHKFFTVVGGKRVAAKPSKKVEEASRQLDIEVERYLARMGASPELMTEIRRVPYENLRTLSKEEVMRYGIATRSTAAR